MKHHEQKDAPLRLVKPDLYVALARAGYRRTLRDRCEDFLFDIRLRPSFALAVAALGFAAGMLGVIVPALLIAWSVR